MFNDIHEFDKLKLTKHRIIGTGVDEILFADDTICISESDKALTRLLHEIENESEDTKDVIVKNAFFSIF